MNDFGAVQRGNGEELASRLHTPVSCTFCTRSVNPVSPGSQRRFWTELMAADSTESSDFAVIPFGSEYLHFFAVKTLIDGLLSEPYSTFTYRYFLRQWSELCFLAVRKLPHAASCTPLRSEDLFGCIIGKAEVHRDSLRGYIAMIAVDMTHRRRGLGTLLVQRTLQAMQERGCDEVVLETEVTNHSALRMYEKLGFLRDKRLERYYLNGSDAFRLRRRLVPLPMPNIDSPAPQLPLNQKTSEPERITESYSD